MEKSIFGLLILAVSSTYAVQWAYQPNPVALKGDLTITCDATEDINIYHKNVQLTNAAPYTPTKTVTGGKTSIKLKISPVLEAQAGDYFCRSVADPTKQAKATVRIGVATNDDGKKYKKAIGSKANVEFYVIGYPRPEIQYFKKTASGAQGELLVTLATDGTLTKGANGARFSITTDKGYMVIDGVKTEDGGQYSVVVTSLGAAQTFSLTLEVGESPKIISAPKKMYNFTSGVAANIVCSFQAAPTTVKWTVTTTAGVKSDITASSTGNIKLDGTNLKIDNPTRANEGDAYECYGENAFGSVTAKTSVNVVYEKPVVAALTTPVKVIEGNSETLSCQATGNPKPVVQWSFKSGDSYSVLSGQNKSPGASSYTIAKADASHAGEYKCEAFLKDKKDFSDAKMLTVELLTMPKIDASKTTVSQEYAIGKNESKNLVCVATGSPAPTLMLMKGSKVLSTVAPTKPTSVEITFSYVANEKSDAGVITCMAKSSVGNVTKDISIVIIDKPQPPSGLIADITEYDYVELMWGSSPKATSYKVYQDGVEVKETPTTRAKIEKLEGGKFYKFTVSAGNVAGFGPQSSVFSVTTKKFGKPSAPQQDAKGAPKKFTGPQATFQWQAPVNDGGDKNMKYDIRYCPQDDTGSYPPAGCKTVTSNTTSVTITGLKENTMYHFKISAKNQRGSSDALEFAAKTGASKAPPTTTGPAKPTAKPGKKKGLGGGAIAGIIIAVILILLIVIDLFCCFFNECGFTHCCYQACCAGKGKGKYAATDSKDPEKHELKDQENDQAHEPEVKTTSEEKAEEPAKEKKTEDV